MGAQQGFHGLVGIPITRGIGAGLRAVKEARVRTAEGGVVKVVCL